MSLTFISHAVEDRYVVDLLAALLEFHDVNAWCSGRHLGGGVVFRTEIDKALKHADSVIVVVSNHSASSQWVAKEVTTFCVLKPDATVIPILLDDTSPDAIADRLSERQALHFGKDMLSGFQDLLELFGKEFLPKTNRRNKSERRGQGRRKAGELRLSPLIQRLRVGFWKSFAERMAMGKFDDLKMSVSTMMKSVNAVGPEAAKYELLDRTTGARVDTDKALETAATEVWSHWRPRGSVRAVNAVEAIAEAVHDAYIVQPRARRRVSDQRTRPPRRKG